MASSGLVAPSAALHQKISSLNTTLGVGRTPPDAPHRCRSAPCGPRTCSTSCTVARLASLGACLGVMGGKFRGLGVRCCSADRRMGVGPVGWPSRRSMRPVAGACGAHPGNPTSEERSSKDARLTRGWPPHSVWGATQSDPALAHTDGPFRSPVMTTGFRAPRLLSDILARCSLPNPPSPCGGVPRRGQTVHGCIRDGCPMARGAGGHG